MTAPTPLAAAVVAPDVDRRRWLILAVLCVSLLIVSLDGTILNVALPTLVTRLHATGSGLQWISDVYTLVFASLLLTAGSLGDRYGRRGALMAGLAIFGGLSVASAFAASVGQLIWLRALMGVGGALIMPATLSILTNVFPSEERSRAIGIWAGVAGLGVAVGPVVGGVLLRHFWWGSIFLVNGPVAAAGLVAVAAFVPTSKNPAAPPLDPVGAALSVGGLTALLYAIIEAPTHGWESPATLAAFAGGAVILGAFVAWELRNDHPVLDVRLFANPPFSAASAAVALAFFAMFGSLFFLSQYLQDVLGYNALQAGLRVAPLAVALMIAAPASSSLVERFGAKLVVAAGLLLVAGALLMLAQANVGGGFTAGYGLVASAVIALGLGIGLATTPATDSIMGSLPVEQAGVASAVNDTTREVGGAFGIAVLGSLTNAAYQTKVASSPPLRALSSAARARARSSIGAAHAVAAQVAGSVGSTAGAAVAHAANVAFVAAMSHTVTVAAVVAAIGAVVALAFLPAHAIAGAGELTAVAVAAARILPAPARRAAVVDRAMAVFGHGGQASLNFNALTSQTGVATASMQHGWRGRLQSVTDAIDNLVVDTAAPTGGTLVEDSIAFIRRMIHTIHTNAPPPVLAALIGAAANNPTLAHRLRTSLIGLRQQALRDRFERAVATGELSADIDLAFLADLLIGAVYHRILISGEPVGPDFPDRLVALTIAPHVLGSTPVSASVG